MREKEQVSSMPRLRNRATNDVEEKVEDESSNTAVENEGNGDVSPGGTEDVAEQEEEDEEEEQEDNHDDEEEVKEEPKKSGKIPKKIKKRKQEEEDEESTKEKAQEEESVSSKKKRTRAEAKVPSAEDLEFEKSQIVNRIVVQQTQAELVEFIKRCAMSNESVYDELIQVAQNNPLQRKLYIRHGVSKSSEDTDLRAFFDKHYGVVEECIIIKGDSHAKGAYAFVVMKDVTDFDKALKDDGVVSFEGGGIPLTMQYSAIKGSIGKPDPKEKDGQRDRDSMKDGRGRDRDLDRDRGRGRSGRRDRSTSRDRDDREVRDIEKSRLEQRKIFVRNLPDAATNRDLEATFSKYGSLDECEVIMNKNSTVSKGYGFVTFSRASEASRALESPRKIVCGKETISQYASTNRKGSDSAASDPRSTKYDDVGTYGPQSTSSSSYSSGSYSSSSYGGGRSDTSSSIQELPSQPALDTYQYKAAVNNQPQYAQPSSATQYGSNTTQYGIQPSPLYNTGHQQQQPYQYSTVPQGHPGSTMQYSQQQQQQQTYDPTNPTQNTLYAVPGAVPQQQYYGSQQQTQTVMPQTQTQQYDQQQQLQPQYAYQQPNQPVYRQNPNYHT